VLCVSDPISVAAEDGLGICLYWSLLSRNVGRIWAGEDSENLTCYRRGYQTQF
jgi:hypothetical protein